MAKEVSVVLQDINQNIYTNVFSTRKKADKAVGDVILKRAEAGEIGHDPETVDEIKERHGKKDYAGVMATWNEWSIETEYRDEYAIEMRTVDAELPSS